ncbi:MAG TPA: glutaredoxin family protein [Thermoleophilaceae bacterium]|nr:glutaredoxin family protein [Thermoleophilaceae bacterium]
MYVKPGCPYCASAREGLTERGLRWEERDATERPEWRQELFEHSAGTGVVPTIVGPEGTEVGWNGRG